MLDPALARAPAPGTSYTQMSLHSSTTHPPVTVRLSTSYCCSNALPGLLSPWMLSSCLKPHTQWATSGCPSLDVATFFSVMALMTRGSPSILGHQSHHIYTRRECSPPKLQDFGVAQLHQIRQVVGLVVQLEFQSSTSAYASHEFPQAHTIHAYPEILVTADPLRTHTLG